MFIADANLSLSLRAFCEQVGSAAVAVLLARSLGLKSAADVGVSAKAWLKPFDDWLQRSGDGMVDAAGGVGRAFDGAFDSAAKSWRESWLGSAMRGRVERIAEHHEQKELQRKPEASS